MMLRFSFFICFVSSSVVSLAAVFVSSRNAPSQQINGGALRDETKTAAREASSSAATDLLFLFFEALSLAE